MEFMELANEFIKDNRSAWIAFRFDKRDFHWIDYFESIGEIWEDAVISTAIILGMDIRRSR